VPNYNPSPATRFKPGQSGNPSGRPKRSPITTALIELLEEKAASKALAAKWLSEAAKGDPRFFAMLLDRVEGRVPDSPEPIGEAVDPIEDIRRRGEKPKPTK
jgi:hypothetical protein